MGKVNGIEGSLELNAYDNCKKIRSDYSSITHRKENNLHSFLESTPIYK